MNCHAELGPSAPARVRLHAAGLELERAGRAVVERTRDRAAFGPAEAAASRRALVRARDEINAALGDGDSD